MAHPWLWAGLFALILGAIAVDLGVHRHRRHPSTLRGAIAWSLLWIALSLAYGGLVWWRRGGDAATTFYTAWLLEKSLSFDNLMVFLLALAATVGILGATAAASLLRRPRTATAPTPPSPARRAAPDARACAPASPAEAEGRS